MQVMNDRRKCILCTEIRTVFIRVKTKWLPLCLKTELKKIKIYGSVIFIFAAVFIESVTLEK